MLRNMKVSELQKLARAEGIDEDVIDDTMEAERPKDALVSLIASNRATRDPPMVQVVVPSDGQLDSGNASDVVVAILPAEST